MSTITINAYDIIRLIQLLEHRGLAASHPFAGVYFDAQISGIRLLLSDLEPIDERIRLLSIVDFAEQRVWHHHFGKQEIVVPPIDEPGLAEGLFQ